MQAEIQINFWPKKNFQPKNFRSKKFIRPKTIFQQKNFLIETHCFNQKKIWLKIFFKQKIFSTKNIFHHSIFWPKKYFVQQIFYQKFYQIYQKLCSDPKFIRLITFDPGLVVYPLIDKMQKLCQKQSREILWNQNLLITGS